VLSSVCCYDVWFGGMVPDADRMTHGAYMSELHRHGLTREMHLEAVTDLSDLISEGTMSSIFDTEDDYYDEGEDEDDDDSDSDSGF